MSPALTAHGSEQIIGPALVEAASSMGDAWLASEQVQVISSRAESCPGRVQRAEGAKWLKHVEAEPRATWDVGSIHWGNLWRKPIKVVDQLTFKETVALGQTGQSWRGVDGTSMTVSPAFLLSSEESTGKALGVTILVICCCVTNYLQLP